jgi:hypothetical protein
MLDVLSQVVTCPEHGVQPWALVCIHVLSGGLRADNWRWVRIDDGREVDADWVCAECFSKHQAGADPVENLRVCCARHLRELRLAAGVVGSGLEYWPGGD